MPSPMPAAAVLAAILSSPALAQSQTPNPCNPVQKTVGRIGGIISRATGGAAGQQSQPCTAEQSAPAQTAAQNADRKSKFRPVSGSYNGTFLARGVPRQMSVMGPITWTYRSPTIEVPTVYWNPGIVVNGNVSTPTLWFAGDQGAVQDGQGHYYLETGRGDDDVALRVTVANGRFDVAVISPKDVPADLLKLDGTKSEREADPAPTAAGALQVKVSDPKMARSILLQTPSRDNDPFLREGVRIAVLTSGDQTPLTVYQTNLDPPIFWRLVNDNYQARLFEDGKITLLRRVLNAPNGHWNVMDASGQKTGEYINPGYAPQGR